jgi:hypothetical protein
MKSFNRSHEKWLAKQREKKLHQIDWYLSKGWAVFPVNGEKKPLIPNGCHGATTDREHIQQWWQDNPYANVAIATGRKSNLLVIDLDDKNGKDGLTSLDAVYGEFLDINLEKQLIAMTPNNGIHLYYQWNENFPVTVAAGVVPGVDIRGEGGYVVAPPSRIKVDSQWHSYNWANAKLPVPLLPAWAIDLCEQTLKPSTSTFPSSNGSSTDSKLDLNLVMTGIPEGQRDDQLYRYACHLMGRGVPYDLALGFMRTAASFCIPPFPEAIAIEKINSVYQYLQRDFPRDDEV